MKFSKTPDKKFLLFLLTLFLAGSVQAAPARQNAVVLEALSGDTVKLKGGKELRYIGVEAPPVKSQIALSQQYGQESLSFNRNLVEGKTITIEWGPQLRDKKNRLLGYVYLSDGTFVNRQILRRGHAKLRASAPNLQHLDDFRKDQLEAQRERAGLWLKEPLDEKLSSNVLGNKVGKIFFYPDSPELDDVPEAQLVRFRSRIEAVAAGYKPCYSCRNRVSTEDPESP